MTVTLSNRVATQIIELSEIGSTLYLGDYDYYLEKKAEQEALREETEQVDSDKPAPANDYQLQKENQKEQRRLARRLEQLEAQSRIWTVRSVSFRKPCRQPTTLANSWRFSSKSTS